MPLPELNGDGEPGPSTSDVPIQHLGHFWSSARLAQRWAMHGVVIIINSVRFRCRLFQQKWICCALLWSWFPLEPKHIEEVSDIMLIIIIIIIIIIIWSRSKIPYTTNGVKRSSELIFIYFLFLSRWNNKIFNRHKAKTLNLGIHSYSKNKSNGLVHRMVKLQFLR